MSRYISPGPNRPLQGLQTFVNHNSQQARDHQEGIHLIQGERKRERGH
jgi:hypothetical protein